MGAPFGPNHWRPPGGYSTRSKVIGWGILAILVGLLFWTVWIHDYGIGTAPTSTIVTTTTIATGSGGSS